ncbi:hypothetical protein [uncultured Polaribacter sp.]|uniref:hypothetical protein n=1 Tax=uncultured Polaribacter sp. TaxID=174711 RepID=UPI00260E9711|nr:hypothetical protein [uncultured Polaribacter sp.]
MVVTIGMLLIVISLFVSSFFWDFSWDGQWYHQSAIYNITDGWNPIKEPIRKFNKNNDLSIVHFPKGSWYFAASTFSAFGFFEAGKALNFIVLFVLAFFSYDVSRKFNLNKLHSILVAVLLVFNPVIWSEIATYMVDQLLCMYLTIYLLALFSLIKKYNFYHLLIGIMAVIGLINVKFTGGVFIFVFSSFGFLYIFFKKREILLKYIKIHIISAVLGVLVFGFNPYISNFTERGNPLYPILGSKEYPSRLEQGFDGNEKHETPKNMQKRAFPIRFFYAHFGTPSNAPYDGKKNAELTIPFVSTFSSWDAYRFHETRVAGFGPFFSGLLLLSLLYLLYYIKRNKEKRLLVLCIYGALISSLLISKHFWWARFAPQIWFFLIAPLILGLFFDKNKKLKHTLIFATIVNAIIVIYIHTAWEFKNTLKFQKELSLIKQENKEIQVGKTWFKKSIEERFKVYDIKYTFVSRKKLKQKHIKKLSNVPKGYPGTLMYNNK